MLLYKYVFAFFMLVVHEVSVHCSIGSWKLSETSEVRDSLISHLTPIYSFAFCSLRRLLCRIRGDTSSTCMGGIFD